MGIKIMPEEFLLMRSLIEGICGIRVADDKSYLVEDRLGNLLNETGCCSFNDFYFKVKNGQDFKLRDKIIDHITTNETLWFRDTHPFSIIKEVLLPKFAEEIKKGKRAGVRIWSAASSTGQEPYSVAMLILDAIRFYPHLTSGMFEIMATDISISALRLAMIGKYDNIAINRGLPELYQTRYFNNEGRLWSISEEVKKMVTFKKFNLQDSFALLGTFDIILCRNVAIYFSDTFKRKLFHKIANSLNTESFFFLGTSESVSAYTTKFKIIEYNNRIYYRLCKR